MFWDDILDKRVTRFDDKTPRDPETGIMEGAATRVFDALPSQDKQAVWLEMSDHVIFWDYEREQVAAAVLGFLRRMGG